MSSHRTATQADDWFRDPGLVLAELRRTEGACAPHPAISGYDHGLELGRGGQGVVYLATQRSTGRRVALKVLSPRTADDSTARRRFEREIELIASLRHPNIVAIFDSGVMAAPDERLYFVMEFIEGRNLEEFATELRSRQSPSDAHAELLRLFAIIAEAVAHAHQRGVIHRDLKPANIRIDAEGRPHILDFGLAKVIEGEDRSVTLSETGHFLGSLPWSSPEQAEGNQRLVDTRSDVYSLGVIFYQVLTGRFPYDVTGGMRQMLEKIASAEPGRLRDVTGGLDDEIEAIVLRCLAKEPDRRYQSAIELARDLRRYLAGEPIEARRDSAWYNMRKTLRRYRLTAGVGAAMCAVLAVAVAAVSWQVHVANAAQRAEEQQRRLAEQRFKDVRELAHRFMFDFHDQIEPLAGSRKARELLVTSALEYLEKLSHESGEDRDLLNELASAYSRVGDIQGSPYGANLGDTAGALASYEKARAIREKLVAAHPADAELRRAFARSINQIGDLQQWGGKTADALTSFQRAREILDQTVPLAPDNADLRRELAASELKTGDAISWEGRNADALPHLRAAAEIIENLHAADPANVRDGLNLSVCHSKIGYSLSQTGDREGALEHQRAALDLTERLAAANPDNANVRRTVSINLNQVGAVLASLDRPQEALVHFRRALDLAAQLHAADTTNPLAVSDVTYTRNKIGETLMGIGDAGGALAEFTEACRLRAALAAKDPENAGFQRDLAVSHTLVGGAYRALAEKSTDLPNADRLAHWTAARAALDQSRNIFLRMRERGALRSVDASQPEELLEQLNACDQAIALLRQQTPAPSTGG